MAQPFKQRKKVYLPTLNAEFPNHTWVFWNSPTLPVLVQLSKPFALVSRNDITDVEREEAEDAYFAAVSEIVLDTGESGLDLSTPEMVHSAFADVEIDTELLTGIVNTYIDQLLKERDALQKKAGERPTITGG